MSERVTREVAALISGELVNLRALELEDLDNVLSWINDRDVTKYLTMIFPVSRTAEKEWLEKVVRGQDQANRVFAVEAKDGTYLGSVGLHRINYIDGTAELGIVIGKKDYWGKGFGTDAARTMLRFGFRDMRLRKVILRVFDFNTRAISSYKKMGFKEVGRLKAHVLRQGSYADEVLMEVFAEELV